MQDSIKLTHKIRPQIFAAIIVNIGGFAWGNAATWSATALPKLRKDGSFGNVTEDDESWVSSIALLGACLAGLPTGLLVDKVGRRRLMLILALPLFGGWLVIYFARNVGMLITGRILTGFCAGAFSSTAPLYIAETSQPRIRGMLISGFDLMITIGNLVVLIIGTYLSWRNQALACTFVPFVFFTLLVCIPESPRFLLSRGRRNEATRSLQWLRGVSRPEEIKEELYEMEESSETSNTDNLTTSFKDLWSASVRKPMLLSFMLFLFQVMTGINAIMFYTIDVFKAAGYTMEEYQASTVVGIVRVISAVCSASLIDKFGRRVLLLLSESLVTISLIGLGTFFNIEDNGSGNAENGLSWLPLTCFLIYAAGYSIGMGPIPFSVSPEILPQNVRGPASTILATWKWGVAFLVTKFFYKLREGLGDDGCYWFFASFSLLGGIFIYFCIPETKGKSLEDIQRRLNKNYTPLQ